MSEPQITVIQSYPEIPKDKPLKPYNKGWCFGEVKPTCLIYSLINDNDIKQKPI